MRTQLLIVSAIVAAACTSPGRPQPDAAQRYAEHCKGLGHAPGSEQFRACVETQDLNAAALAAQRDYDRKLLRRADCVDPRFACDTPAR